MWSLLQCVLLVVALLAAILVHGELQPRRPSLIESLGVPDGVGPALGKNKTTQAVVYYWGGGQPCYAGSPQEIWRFEQKCVNLPATPNSVKQSKFSSCDVNGTLTTCNYQGFGCNGGNLGCMTWALDQCYAFQYAEVLVQCPYLGPNKTASAATSP